MAVDPTVIDVLRAGVADAPDNVPLRLHLVAVLVESQLWAEALEHAGVVLVERPTDLQALAYAADAAEGIGDTERARAYRSILEALTRTSAHQGRTDEVPADRFDAFLREVVADAEVGTDPDVDPGVDVDVERPGVSLADVGGLDEVKRRLTTSFLAPMRNPELRKMYGTSLQGGLLLYGPPGCGKTFLARAVAGELDARFFSVGLHEVLDMWLGQSEQNLHAVFETARRNAPCVLFLDEVDALGLKRSNLGRSASRNVVVQLLTELDSTLSVNDGVFVLGATNQPWDLDPALRRPGRFDRMLLVLPPDEAARLAILVHHVKDRPVSPHVDLRWLAKRTDGYSGADLRLVCESAAESALEDSITTGSARPIEQRDFEQALRDAKPSTRPWFETAKNYAMFANQDGTYDDLLAYMRQHRLG